MSVAGSEPPTLAVVGTGEVRAPAGDVVGVAPLTVAPAVGVVTVGPEGSVPESSRHVRCRGPRSPPCRAPRGRLLHRLGERALVAAIAVPVEAASVTATRADAASDRRRGAGRWRRGAR